MTTTTTAPRPAHRFDPYQDDPTLRAAEAAVDTAAASGDTAVTTAAARALIVAAAAYGWPTATGLIYKRETTGPTAHGWALWKVLDAHGQVLREWDDEPDDMTDESEEELIAQDLISNRTATQDYAATFGPLTPGAVVGFHTLAP